MISITFSDEVTDSHKFWADKFKAALEKWRKDGVIKEDGDDVNVEDLDATANFDPNVKQSIYPEETPENSFLQAATHVEEHLQSLTLCKYKCLLCTLL